MKKPNKLITIIITILICLIPFGIEEIFAIEYLTDQNGMPLTYKENNIIYYFTVENTIEVSTRFYEAYSMAEGDVVILSEVDGRSVTHLSSFDGAEKLTSIVIPDSIIIIKNGAFEQCFNLKSIKFGNGITSIGDYAFNYCKSLTSIILGNNVENIGFAAFADCKSLIDIVLPDSVISIDDYAFSNCENLTEVIIPKNVTDIGKYAFGYYSFLDENSDWAVKKFQNFKIYGYLNSCAEEYALENDIPFIALDEKPYTIDYTDENRVNYSFINENTAMVRAGNKGYEAGSPEAEGDIVILSEVEGRKVITIGEFAFQYCEITSVVIPDSVTAINRCAFSDSSTLTSVEIGENIISIGEFAFRGNENLTSITIPPGVISIKNNAFSNCPNLTIYGYSNSVAESYAKSENIPFVSIGEVPLIIEPTELPRIYIENDYVKLTQEENGKRFFNYSLNICAENLPEKVKSLDFSILLYSEIGINFIYDNAFTPSNIGDFYINVVDADDQLMYTRLDVSYIGLEPLELASDVLGTINIRVYLNSSDILDVEELKIPLIFSSSQLYADDKNGNIINYNCETTNGSLTISFNREPALIGDVNLDGKISISDIILLAKAISNKVTLDPIQKVNADCFAGSGINGEDLLVLINHLMGEI